MKRRVLDIGCSEHVKRWTEEITAASVMFMTMEEEIASEEINDGVGREF